MPENQTEKQTYKEADGDLAAVKGKTIAVIGYGNQGRAQALNMRDSGLKVIVGSEDESSTRAWEDGFPVITFSEAANEADILFLLLPDEVIPSIFEETIRPKLRKGSVLCFASGYTLAFRNITPPPDVDIIMIAPRMIGVGVRENYLNQQGFFSFVCVHQNSTGNALPVLLGLSLALGTLKKGAVTVTMKQEAVLDLYNEQAFGPAFGKVLLTSVDVLLKKGLPAEAVLIEMYLSGEMSYTYRKFAEVGIVNQLQFHSHTSQYGAMSRGVRYMKLPLREKFEKTYDEIESGSFAEEWSKPLAKLKLKVLRFFASKQKIGKVERKVRESLGLKVWDPKIDAAEVERLMENPAIKEDLGSFEGYSEY